MIVLYYDNSFGKEFAEVIDKWYTHVSLEGEAPEQPVPCVFSLIIHTPFDTFSLRGFFAARISANARAAAVRATSRDPHQILAEHVQCSLFFVFFRSGCRSRC